MADQESTLRLTAQDLTGRAIKSVSDALKRLAGDSAKTFAPMEQGADKAFAAAARAAQKAGVSLRAFNQLPVETKRRLEEAARIAESLGNNMDTANKKAAVSARGLNHELMGMAKSYLGIAAVAETVRRSFLNFANLDERLRKLSLQAGEPLEKLQQQFAPAMQALSRQTGQSLDSLIEGFDTLREEAKLSLDETMRIWPTVAKAAHGAGVEAKNAGEITGVMMRQMGVGADEVGRAWDHLTTAQFDMRMNMDELVRSFPQLAEKMGHFGFTGEKGVARMLTALAAARDATGSMQRGAMQLGQIMERITTKEVANAFRFTEEGWDRYLAHVQETGGDVLTEVMKLGDEYEKRGGNIEKLFGPRMRGVFRELRKQMADTGDATKKFAEDAGTAARASEFMAKGAKKSWNDVLNELTAVSVKFGELLDQLSGASGFMGSIAGIIESTKTDIENILTLLRGGNPFKMGDVPMPPPARGRGTRRTGRYEGGFTATPQSQIDEAFKQMPEHELGEQERKAIERFKELNNESQRLKDSFRLLEKMSYVVVPGGEGDARVFRAGLGGGGGGARLMPAALGGPGGVGGGAFAPGYGGGGRFGGGGWGGGAMAPGGAGAPGGAMAGPGGGGGVQGGAEPMGGLGGPRAAGKGAGFGGRRPAGPGGGEMPGGGGGPATGGAGASIYNKLRDAYQKSGLVGTIPPGGEKFGFKTGSADEWARFGTAVANAESSFNPRTANTKDPGGSFGVFQYAHGQVPGGNAYDIDKSVEAFVRDSKASVESGHGLGPGGILGRRFKTIGARPDLATAKLGKDYQTGGGGPIAADTGQGGGQRYNYFQSKGTPPPGAGGLVTLDTPFGRVKAHPEAAEDVQGFMGELSKEGAPIKKFGSYADREKRYGGGKSSHAYGAAFDIDDEVQLSPAMRSWIAENPERWARLKSKYNMGQPPSLAKKDPGHVEWMGKGKPGKPAGETAGDAGGKPRGHPFLGAKKEEKADEDLDVAAGKHRRIRQEMEQPIKVQFDHGRSAQFARASMRREANREVREARNTSYADIGAA